MVNSFDHRFKQRSSLIRQLQNLLDNEEQEGELTYRSDRRIFGDDDDDEKEEYMILRATSQSNDTNAAIEITLQNRAAMNTRLRVLYTDANGSPSIAETGRLWAGQTKSVTLPAGSKNIKIIVEKDIFFESWRVAYEGTLTNGNECIRIVGVTLFSKIHSCK